MDYGRIAGEADAVKEFCDILAVEIRGIGLEFNPGKSKPMPLQSSDIMVQNMFPGYKHTYENEGGVEFLGAPFGSDDYILDYLRERTAKGAELLTAASEMGDPISGLHLIRYCLSFCKVSFSTRTVPPDKHRTELKQFQEELRMACSR